jgi:biotin-(acetyl-CoA carboxylase) ligase
VKVVSEFLNVFLELTKDLSAQRFLPEYRKRQLVAGQYVEVLRSGAASAAASTPAPALAAASGAAAASDNADSTAGTSVSANSAPASNAGGRNIALALGIDDQCRLIVHYPDGSEEHLNSGEVRIVPMTRQ